jgi:hypothetical protein
MSFAWINDNVKRDLSDIYQTVGHLAMIAGHPYENLIRARGPVPKAAWPPPLDDYVDGPLRVAVASSRAGLIAELSIGVAPWFEIRQECFEAANFHAYDWGDYFSMSIDRGWKSRRIRRCLELPGAFRSPTRGVLGRRAQLSAETAGFA